MLHIQEKYKKNVIPAMREKFGYRNIMAVPKIHKVVVSIGIGRLRDEKEKEEVKKYLRLITGQEPSPRPAKKAIAAFKTREGLIIGYQVTLHGKRMYDFVSRMIDVALPRTRDFRGLSAKAIDNMGNFTIGIKEHTIFPETSDEDLKDVFGLAITIVTTAPSKAEAEAFFRHLGMPLIVDSGAKR